MKSGIPIRAFCEERAGVLGERVEENAIRVEDEALESAHVNNSITLTFEEILTRRRKTVSAYLPRNTRSSLQGSCAKASGKANAALSCPIAFEESFQRSPPYGPADHVMILIYLSSYYTGSCASLLKCQGSGLIDPSHAVS